MRPHGRARVDPQWPQAFATCDRCSLLYNLVDLHRQFEWGGVKLIDTGFLCCDICLDIPNDQLKARFLPADPVPVRNPRVDLALLEVDDVRVTEDDDIRITEADDTRVLEGEPPE